MKFNQKSTECSSLYKTTRTFHVFKKLSDTVMISIILMIMMMKIMNERME